MVNMTRNKLIKGIGVILFNIVVVTLVFEVLFRIDYFEQYLYQKSWDQRVVLHSNPMLEHIFKPSHKFRASELFSDMYKAYGTALLGDDYTFETNKIGLREKEILPKNDNEIIVLFLGDSLVAGTQVNKEFIMSSVSEKILNDFSRENNLNISFRTINGGIDGYNLINSLENYKRISKIIKPDIIVLGVFNNDIMPYSKYFSTGMKIKYILFKYSFTLRMMTVLKARAMLYLTKDDDTNIENTNELTYQKFLDRDKLSQLYPKYFPNTASLMIKHRFSDSYPQRSLGWLKDSIIHENLLTKSVDRPLPESDYQSAAYIIKFIHDEVTKNNIPLLICLFPLPSAYDDNELHFALEYFGLEAETIDRNRLLRCKRSINPTG